MQFTVKTRKEEEIIDITEKVKEIASKSDVEFGMCLVYAMHTTCAVIINENADPGIYEDILNSLKKLIPRHARYKHDKIDDNAHAHIKAAILGSSQAIPVENGILKLGRWQAIALAEFDGPRERNIIVDVVGN